MAKLHEVAKVRWKLDDTWHFTKKQALKKLDNWHKGKTKVSEDDVGRFQRSVYWGMVSDYVCNGYRKSHSCIYMEKAIRDTGTFDTWVRGHGDRILRRTFHCYPLKDYLPDVAIISLEVPTNGVLGETKTQTWELNGRKNGYKLVDESCFEVTSRTLERHYKKIAMNMSEKLYNEELGQNGRVFGVLSYADLLL